MFFFSLLGFLALPVSFSSPQAEETLISQIQQSWNKTKTYQAEFEQIVVSKTLGTREESRGKFSVQKPLRLRWETADGKLIQILSGKEFWQVKTVGRRKHTQVDHYSDISRLTDLGTLTFLSNQVDIRKSYKYKVLSDSPTQVLLALTPRTSSRETLLAEILKPSYLLAALKIESVDSETRIAFKNIQTGVPLEDSLFRYQEKPQDTVHHHVR